jgi:hypothetical protein
MGYTEDERYRVTGIWPEEFMSRWLAASAQEDKRPELPGKSKVPLSIFLVCKRKDAPRLTSSIRIALPLVSY